MAETRAGGGMTANREIITAAITGSPLGRLLGVVLDHAEVDAVRVRLPFETRVTTIGDVVHGGAIAALVDVAATAAAWTDVDMSQSPRGTTVGFTVTFLVAARASDLVAHARVVRRGGSLVTIEVDVRDGGDASVARALVTYKLGGGRS